MIVLIEGTDGSGKSTLATKLSDHLGWPVVHSGGPQRYPGEVDERIREFLQCDAIIFDRFPAVSEAIYASVIRGEDNVSLDSLARYKNKRKLVVYCRPIDGLSRHVPKDNDIDTPEHVAAVEQNHAEILRRYDEWALREADVLYRIGDSVHRIRDLIKGVIKG